MNLTTPVLLLMPLLAAVPSPAASVPATTTQDEASSSGGRSRQEPDYPTSDQLVMAQYEPVNIGIGDLYDVAKDMVARKMRVRDEVTGEILSHPTMQILGDKILIYDVEAGKQRALKVLTELDHSFEPTTKPQKTRVVREYATRFISLGTAYESLRSFRESWTSQSGISINNVSMVEERSTLVLHDMQPRVDDMLAMLARIDTPSPQVLLTCYLVAAHGSADGATVPKDLETGLKQITGMETVHRQAVGMIRTSVQAQDRLTILLESDDFGTHELALRPAAYDPESRMLSFSECALLKSTESGIETLFRTSTSVPGEEFTVIGAVGSDPLYVVLHSKPAN